MDHQTPKWAHRFLRWYCRPEMLEDLEGALFEYYNERIATKGVRRARFHFIVDVLVHCKPYTWKKSKTQFNNMMGNHLKFSIRNIWKNSLNTSLNSIGLATGLASFILIMLWVSKEVSFDQFHEKKDRIYRISNTFRSKAETFSQAPSGPALGAQLHKIFAEVENGTRVFTTSIHMQVDDEPFFQPDVGIADASFLEIFTFPFVEGDPKTALQEPMSIVLTQDLARKFFGDRSPIGERIVLAQDFPMQVTGVLQNVPENSQIQFQCLLSMETVKKIWGSGDFDDRWGGGWFNTYLLLEEGVDPAPLEKDITAFIGEKLEDWAEMGMYYEYFLQPLTSIHLGSNLRYDYDSNGSQQTITIFRAIAILILLLASINYINISTANAMKRAREVGIRKVMGSSRSSIVSQILTETTLIMLISTGMASLLVYLLLPVMKDLTGYDQLVIWTPQNIMVMGLILTLLTLFSGIFPALLVSGFKVRHVIRAGIKRGTALILLRKSLVVVQFTATAILLISMVVTHEQMRFIREKPLGMESEKVIHINFREMPEPIEKSSVLRNELLSLPSIEKVSFLSNSYPVFGLGNSGAYVETGDGTFIQSSIYTLQVDNNFAETFGLELVAGRFFSDDFPADSSQAVIVNEACIGNFGWGSAQGAIGKKFGNEPDQRSVVGVVKDFHFEGLHKRVEPVRILPARPSRYTTMALRFTGDDPIKVIGDIQNAWDRVITTVPLDLSMMNDDIKRQYTAEYNFRTIFMIFGLLSVVIGCLGLIGLVTAAIQQRLKELSIRKVLGASVMQILALINRHYLTLVVVAVILASPLAYWLMDNWLDNFSYRIDFSWLYVVYALVAIVVVTILTISTNSLKTAMTNPADVLKDE